MPLKQQCYYVFTKLPISQPIRHTVTFTLEILEKKNDECILILVISGKKTGLLHTKISKHNIIYSSKKPRKPSSLPLKSSSWLFSLDVSLSSYKMSGPATSPSGLPLKQQCYYVFTKLPISQPIRRTVNFTLEILEKIMMIVF